MQKLLTAIVLLVLVPFLGCDGGPKSARGFSLPDGDAEKGRATYTELQCNACHKIAGIEQLASAEGQPEMSIELGGEVTRIKTYGELVTSIINPSHRMAQGYSAEYVQDEGVSKMPVYNDAMTVAQLTDLVKFLQSKYTLAEYEPTIYVPYGY
jgi:mono/diheme cytochrome c family protein